jgi:N-acetylmuramoyl-L-alanine amidase
LAHVRRKDYLANLLQGAVETLLFFHPATWWVSGMVRQERERACDEAALTATGTAPIEYVKALATLERKRQVLGPALGAGGGDLIGRARRLLGLTPNRSGRPAAVILGVASALLAAVTLTALAQEATGSGMNGVTDLGRAVQHDATVNMVLTEIGGPFRAASGGAAMTPARRLSVVIDPAHSDRFPGAEGPIEEAELTLAVARQVRELLTEQGVNVRLTREECQVTGAEDRWVRESGLAILRLTAGAAVSVELGFLSNPEEGARLASPRYQELLARGLAEGILAYIDQNAPLTLSGPPVHTYHIREVPPQDDTEYVIATVPERDDREYFIETPPLPGAAVRPSSADQPPRGKPYIVEFQSDELRLEGADRLR